MWQSRREFFYQFLKIEWGFEIFSKRAKFQEMFYVLLQYKNWYIPAKNEKKWALYYAHNKSWVFKIMYIFFK